MKPAKAAQMHNALSIVEYFVQKIENGSLKEGEPLPSIDDLTEWIYANRSEVAKAYHDLRKKRYINFDTSKGFFVQYKKKCVDILLIFNRLSSFNNSVYDGLAEGVGRNARIDLQIHGHNPKVLKKHLEANVGKYDYYVIMPHFYGNADHQECISVLTMVPSHRLILLDKIIPELSFSYKAVYQDFKMDIYKGLESIALLFNKYVSVTLVFPDGVYYPREIIEGVKLFCREKNMKFNLIGEVNKGIIRWKTVYIVIEENDLAILVRKVRMSGWILGTDIGIISYNETTLKELLDITVVTTDFKEMGERAAKMIRENTEEQRKMSFRVIKRGSL